MRLYRQLFDSASLSVYWTTCDVCCRVLHVHVRVGVQICRIHNVVVKVFGDHETVHLIAVQLFGGRDILHNLAHNLGSAFTLERQHDRLTVLGRENFDVLTLVTRLQTRLQAVHLVLVAVHEDDVRGLENVNESRGLQEVRVRGE